MNSPQHGPSTSQTDWSDAAALPPPGEGPRPAAAPPAWEDCSVPAIPHGHVYISPPPYTEADGETPSPSEPFAIDD